MRLLRIVLVAVAAMAVAGQYVTERRRLARFQSLPGERARDYYERTRARAGRTMLGLTLVLALAAVAALLRVSVFRAGASVAPRAAAPVVGVGGGGG